VPFKDKEKQREANRKSKKKHAGKVKAYNRAYSRERTKNNPDHVRMISQRSYLKKRYGMSVEEYEALLKAQGGKCAVQGCDSTSPGGRRTNWIVDHDHETGKNRGLLCHRCNVLLGVAKENINVLLGGAEYLEASVLPR
jgi:hypothetical protein